MYYILQTSKTKWVGTDRVSLYDRYGVEWTGYAARLAMQSRYIHTRNLEEALIVLVTFLTNLYVFIDPIKK